MTAPSVLAAEQVELLGALLRAVGGPRLHRLDAAVVPIAERLLANALDLEELVSSLLVPADPPIDDHEARRRAYEALVVRVREKVAAVVPPGHTYLVVTRGDGNLVLAPDRTGRHFPAGDDGRWIGYHPANAADALAHLRRERAGGARWFVVPATSSWWLEHYGELRAHLASGRLALQDDDVTIFELVDDLPMVTAKVARYHEQISALRSIVRILVPRNAVVLVASRGDDTVLQMGDVDARHFSSIGNGQYGGQLVDGADGIAQLANAFAEGARFLAIPAWQRWWLDVYPDLAEHLRLDHVCVADQAEAGLLFELRSRPPRQGAP